MPEILEPKLYLGIDPGLSGGIAGICSGRIRYYRMPATAGDIHAILLDETRDRPLNRTVCAIEKVQSSPQMGVVSAFTFGKNYGTLLGILASLAIPTEEVSPQRWQKALGIPPRKKSGKQAETQGQFKRRLRAKAQQLFPSLDLWKETMGAQLACCDALLLAEYYRRTCK
jgi:hypothetical protein